MLDPNPADLRNKIMCSLRGSLALKPDHIQNIVRVLGEGGFVLVDPVVIGDVGIPDERAFIYCDDGRRVPLVMKNLDEVKR